MNIRRYRSGEGHALAELMVQSIRTIAPRFYSPEQVEAWASNTSGERLTKRLEDGRTVWVAADTSDRPVAFIDLEADGHIDFMYASPAVSGSPVTVQLYETLEAEAWRQGIGRLYVEASEAALRFFAKRGFAVLHRRDIEVAGVPIHNYAMEKRLADQAE